MARVGPPLQFFVMVVDIPVVALGTRRANCAFGRRFPTGAVLGLVADVPAVVQRPVPMLW